ncbi:MAG TPA: hypothetical protein VGE77_12770, partial [Nocardioides sp.]
MDDAPVTDDAPPRLPPGRLLWACAGIAAAALGAGLSELAAGALTLHVGPVSGVREVVGAVLPSEFVVHNGIDLVAIVTGPPLVVLLALVLVTLAAVAGVAASGGWRRPAVVTAVVLGLGVLSAFLRPDPSLVDVAPVVAGTAGFGLGLALLAVLLARLG